jgi:hypothetical protein
LERTDRQRSIRHDRRVARHTPPRSEILARSVSAGRPATRATPHRGASRTWTRLTGPAGSAGYKPADSHAVWLHLPGGSVYSEIRRPPEATGRRRNCGWTTSKAAATSKGSTRRWSRGITAAPDQNPILNVIWVLDAELLVQSSMPERNFRLCGIWSTTVGDSSSMK